MQVAGVAALAALPAPVPDPAQSDLLLRYLTAAAAPPDHPSRDAAFARWLGVGCVHLAVRALHATATGE